MNTSPEGTVDRKANEAEKSSKKSVVDKSIFSFWGSQTIREEKLDAKPESQVITPIKLSPVLTDLSDTDDEEFPPLIRKKLL